MCKRDMQGGAVVKMKSSCGDTEEGPFNLPCLEGSGMGERLPREGTTHEDFEGSLRD